MIAEALCAACMYISQTKYFRDFSALLDRLNKDGISITEYIKDPRFKTFNPNSLARKSNSIDISDPKQHRYMRDESIDRSLNFIAERGTMLEKAEKLFGIPKEYVTAALNIESDLGGNNGQTPVFNALMSNYLLTDRKELFYEFITEFVKLVDEWDIKDAFAIKGSFAGAATPAQVMPTGLRKYAVDMNGDGFRFDDKDDAIGTCARFLEGKGGRNNIYQALVAYNGERYAKGVEKHANAIKVRLKSAPIAQQKPFLNRKVPSRNNN